MNEDIITMLDEQIKAELGDLANLTVGSKEHTEAIEGLAKLYRLRIDDSKAAMEYNKEIDDDNFRREQREKEEQLQRDKMEQEAKLHREKMEQEEKLQRDKMEQEAKLQREKMEQEEKLQRDKMEQEAKLQREKMEHEERSRQEQMEQEAKFHNEQAEREEQSQKEQLAEQKKDRYVRIGIAAAELMVPLVFFAKIYQMRYDLDKDGTFTVQTLKNLIRFVESTKR